MHFAKCLPNLGFLTPVLGRVGHIFRLCPFSFLAAIFDAVFSGFLDSSRGFAFQFLVARLTAVSNRAVSLCIYTNPRVRKAPMLQLTFSLATPFPASDPSGPSLAASEIYAAMPDYDDDFDEFDDNDFDDEFDDDFEDELDEEYDHEDDFGEEEDEGIPHLDDDDEEFEELDEDDEDEEEDELSDDDE